MTISPRDRRMLLLLAPALLLAAILKYVVFTDATPTRAADIDNIAMAEQRAARLRQIVALIPAREAVLKQTAFDLAERERGLLSGDTAAQAQAALIEIARRVGKGEQIEVRAGEFVTPKEFGDYGMVYAAVTFDCHVEQLVNFLSDLTHQPELVVPSEERITAGNAKEKTMSVRMVLAGVVPKKLIPVKKGLGVF
ncbi:MAG: type II secretion system protein GspM [Acidobacteriota bacterium]|nr:type II secretion system protein GspM [Acidobacteriota bacterium]